jgi:DNA-binding response OmpR family regulator
MQSIYPYKILLVEDEELIRENYMTYLKMFFSEVYEAKDGEEAYELYKEKKPDIMIVDINLPKLTGLELLKRIRIKDHKTKAIILTAHTDTSFLLDAASLKLTQYLVKPITRKSLKEALKLTIDELLEFNIVAVQKIDLPQNYSWHVESKELKHYNDVIELTSKERRLLELLLSHKDRVFTYDEIFDTVWEYEEAFSINSLKNIVKRLRKKLPQNSIVNQFNEGYKIHF